MTQSHTAGEPGAHPSVASPAVSQASRSPPGWTLLPSALCSVPEGPRASGSSLLSVDVQVVTQARSPTKKQGSKMGGKSACLPGGPEDVGGHAGCPGFPGWGCDPSSPPLHPFTLQTVVSSKPLPLSRGRKASQGETEAQG